MLKGIVLAVSLFIGNVLSVAATSFLTMPAFVRWFDWWLFPGAKSYNRATAIGLAVLAALFAADIGFVAWLFWWHGV